MKDDNQSFAYTYNAKEQDEIKKIREKYTGASECETDKMEQLRRLDAGVTHKANVVSLVIGVIGALILGTGMSLAMTDLGDHIGMGDYAMPIGILVGTIGIVLVSLAYPIYTAIVKKERERIAPEILRLTDELMK